MQDVLKSAIHEDLCGGESAAGQIKGRLLQEGKGRAQAREDKAQKGGKGSAENPLGSISHVSNGDAASGLEGHHRSKSSSIASRVGHNIFPCKQAHASSLPCIRHALNFLIKRHSVQELCNLLPRWCLECFRAFFEVFWTAVRFLLSCRA